ncbi:MAG: sulfotransferase domain-containing protein, partial [Burkholderiaceae bacterium]|nr:sulfotransferase domain-containing protein [Burkholderiaceae bacterium]
MHSDDGQPLSFTEGSGCYCYRDIRDVAVSALRKFGMTFDGLIASQWLDQAISDFRAWTNAPTVLVSCYENMIGDLRNEVLRISGFLGANLDNEETILLAKQFTIPAQKER